MKSIFTLCLINTYPDKAKKLREKHKTPVGIAGRLQSFN